MRASRLVILSLAALAVGTFALSADVLARGGGGGGHGGGGHGGGKGGKGGGRSSRTTHGAKNTKTTKKDIEIGREKLRQIDYRDHDAGTDRGAG